MAYLGDYIGYLLSELTVAREYADRESVRIAELYRGDPLLKCMPVPRFRLPNITVDIPVALKCAEDISSELSQKEMFEEMKSGFLKSVDSELKNVGHQKLSASRRKKLSEQLDTGFAQMQQREQGPVRMSVIADGLMDAFNRQVLGPSKTKAIKLKNQTEVSSRLRDNIFQDLSKYIKKNTRLDVEVNAGEMKNLNNKDVITTIRLDITEDAWEWITVDEQSGKEKLIQE